MRLRDVLASRKLGKVYHARFFYGNGTAADVRCSFSPGGQVTTALRDELIALAHSARHTH